MATLIFNHKNIINWSRDRFVSIEEHNNFLVQQFIKWAEKLNKEKDAEFWVLGDWFDTSYLWVMNMFNCKTIFMYGNHDKHTDFDLYKNYFNEVFLYPIYISDRICISHIPQAIFDDQINVYAHLHQNIIDKPNYISACLEVNGYEPLTEKKINSILGRIPKYTRRHLEAPYTEDEKVLHRPQNDLILKPNDHIDVSAMRALKKFEELNK